MEEIKLFIDSLTIQIFFSFLVGWIEEFNRPLMIPGLSLPMSGLKISANIY